MKIMKMMMMFVVVSGDISGVISECRFLRVFGLGCSIFIGIGLIFVLVEGFVVSGLVGVMDFGLFSFLLRF